jgi:hypothetical protein
MDEIDAFPATKEDACFKKERFWYNFADSLTPLMSSVTSGPLLQHV